MGQSQKADAAYKCIQQPYGWFRLDELVVCSAFYNFLFIYWSMISFVLRIQIGIDLYRILDKVLYW